MKKTLYDKTLFDIYEDLCNLWNRYIKREPNGPPYNFEVSAETFHKIYVEKITGLITTNFLGDSRIIKFNHGGYTREVKIKTIDRIYRTHDNALGSTTISLRGLTKSKAVAKIGDLGHILGIDQHVSVQSIFPNDFGGYLITFKKL